MGFVDPSGMVAECDRNGSNCVDKVTVTATVAEQQASQQRRANRLSTANIIIMGGFYGEYVIGGGRSRAVKIIGGAILGTAIGKYILEQAEGGDGGEGGGESAGEGEAPPPFKGPTEEDEADDIFDPGAGPGEVPGTEEEADAIRDAVRGQQGQREMDGSQVRDPAHQGEEKWRVETEKYRIHYWYNPRTGAAYGGKIVRRY